MRIINIIDRFDKVNFGIWNAAIATSSKLKELYGVDSELWFPKTNFDGKTSAKLIPLDIDKENILSILEKRNLNPENDIIVTHGCWQYPTRWGAALKKEGFKWVYVPHGMLEPWSMKQKWLQKKIYFSLIEGKYSKKADAVRAVGSPEFKNLQKWYPNVQLIPNGTEIPSLETKKDTIITFLFMARLHHKKGIIPLAKAWMQSNLCNSANYKLIIAGPDDGELTHLKSKIEGVQNIEYAGAVYGTEKEALLRKIHFYILPSFSEGFPTSVVEAMSFGLVPIITSGCNFPEAFQQKLAIQINPEVDSIKTGLKSAALMGSSFEIVSKRNAEFIKENYSIEKIAELQYNLYTRLLF